MKYAFFPGCVSKGGCPELYQSVMQVYPQLGIELEVFLEMGRVPQGYWP